MPIDIKANDETEKRFESVQLELGIEFVNVCYFSVIQLIDHGLKAHKESEKKVGFFTR